MTENLALYSKIGYTEYDRRPQKALAGLHEKAPRISNRRCLCHESTTA